MRKQVVVCLSLVLACAASWQLAVAVRGDAAERPQPAAAESPGALQALDGEGRPKGLCPLERTDVKAEISGFLARVTVEQKFANPFDDAIEAVYTFHLPHDAAVDRMTMRIGERTIEGKILPRDRARELYDEARNAGKTASLLDQERPNIFTQAVANIPPGERVDVTISYVGLLDYEDGTYQFVFPMVVGPRYVPGQPTGKQGGGWSPDTDRVPDASRITPPVAPPGTRAGHDVSIEVALDAGVPIVDLRSKVHDVDVARDGASAARVTLKQKATIPNKDFVLSYDVAGARLEDALFTHRKHGDGFFTLVLQPPDRPAVEEIAPRELVFVLDTSGSMSGFPIEKAKETMDLAFDAMRPGDAFNLITFAGDTRILFPEPLPATAGNLARAREFLAGSSGGGGTEMMKAIRAALAPSKYRDRVRVVCFMTDGYVGNDMEIVDEIRKNPGARVFSFGIGNSVNRYLLDRMAEAGRGEVEYVMLSDDGSAAARRFAERINAPLLTDVEVDWGGLAVADVYPERIPDVFAAKPVFVVGRYTSPGSGTIRVRGRSGGREVVREIRAELPAETPRADVLAKLWARERVEQVMRRDLSGVQRGAPDPAVKEEITRIGLEYGLMTQFTSFLAVEERVVVEGGKSRRVEVPVEMPEGVSYQGVFGEQEALAGAPPPTASPMSIGGGVMARSAARPRTNGTRVDRAETAQAAEPKADGRAADEARKQAAAVRLRAREIEALAVHKEPLDASLRAHVKAPAEVVVEVTVDETGKVVAARALSGPEILRAAAVEAAKKWRFTPHVVDGSPVRVVGPVTLRLDP